MVLTKWRLSALSGASVPVLVSGAAHAGSSFRATAVSSKTASTKEDVVTPTRKADAEIKEGAAEAPGEPTSRLELDHRMGFHRAGARVAGPPGHGPYPAMEPPPLSAKGRPVRGHAAQTGLRTVLVLIFYFELSSEYRVPITALVE